MLEGNGLLRKGVVMIHDDHAGYSDHIYHEDPEGRSHFHLLRRYLKMCAELNVFLSPKKFEVYIKKPDIAGHLHGDGGLRPNPPRYQAIVEAAEPKTVADVYHAWRKCHRLVTAIHSKFRHPRTTPPRICHESAQRGGSDNQKGKEPTPERLRVERRAKTRIPQAEVAYRSSTP